MRRNADGQSFWERGTTGAVDDHDEETALEITQAYDCGENLGRWRARGVMDDRMRSAIHIAGHVIGAVRGEMGLSIVSLDQHTIQTARPVRADLRVQFLVAGCAAEIAFLAGNSTEMVEAAENDFDKVLEILGGEESPAAMAGMKIALLETTELIRANRRAVSAVANALIERGSLDWNQVCGLLTDTLPEGSFTLSLRGRG
jgi:hypothetical protein